MNDVVCHQHVLILLCAVSNFIIVSMEDFQQPDSDEETEEEVMQRILKRVGGAPVLLHAHLFILPTLLSKVTYRSNIRFH